MEHFDDLNSIKLIDFLKNDFEESQEKFLHFSEMIKSEVVKTILSKGHIFNLRPFEKEISGYHRGKIIPRMPKLFKGLYVYYFDNQKRIIKVENYKNNVFLDTEFCFHEQGQLKSYYFNNRRLRNIKLSLIENDFTQSVFNYGSNGCTISKYIYNKNDELTNILSNTKEHQKENWSYFEIIFTYENSELSKIMKTFSNGYSKELYPTLE
jgi:hypothetical protein